MLQCQGEDKRSSAASRQEGARLAAARAASQPHYITIHVHVHSYWRVTLHFKTCTLYSAAGSQDSIFFPG